MIADPKGNKGWDITNSQTKGKTIYFDLLNECVKLSEQIVLVTVASTSRKYALRFDDKGKSKVLTGPIL